MARLYAWVAAQTPLRPTSDKLNSFSHRIKKDVCQLEQLFDKKVKFKNRIK